MADRKIIQIVATRPGKSLCSPQPYALCDDGTVWQKEDFGVWDLVVAIPQEPTP